MPRPSPTSGALGSRLNGSATRSNRRSAVMLLCLMLGATFPAAAQTDNPVYLDDSPSAAVVLESVPALLQAGDANEAARSIARLLLEEPDRIIDESQASSFTDGAPLNEQLPRGSIGTVHESVRQRAHQLLLSSDELLEAYQRVVGADAQREYDEGMYGFVASHRFMTDAGLTATVRVAERHALEGRFESAILELERATSHPSLDRARAMSLLKVAALCGAHIDEDSFASAMLRSFTARLEVMAGDNAAIPNQRAPRAPRREAVSALSPGGPVRLDGIVAEPLWSVRLDAEPSDTDAGSTLLRGERLAGGDTTPWILPSVVGDRLIINDGQYIRAWDRVSLRPVWNSDPQADGPIVERATPRARRIATSVNDQLRVVSALDDVAVVATGGWGDGRSSLRPLLTAYEATTGELLWQVSPEAIGGEFRYSFVRTPPVISEQTVVVLLTAPEPRRRLTSTYAVGFDLYSGELLWSRLVGSAGVLPSTRQGPTPHHVTAGEGSVYIVDPLGVITSLESRSGRVRWVRTERAEPVNRSRFTPRAWEMPSGALVDINNRRELVAIAPDRLRLIRLDPVSGVLLGSQSLTALGGTRYIVAATDGSVLGIGFDSVFKLELDDDGAITYRQLWRGNDEIAGRVAVVGSDALVPTAEGVSIVPAGGGEPREIELEYSGVMVATEGQLIVTDRGYSHVYLRWPVAERELRRRMDERPGDSAAALVYAQLAWRADEREDAIVALDRAIEASPEGSASARRVFLTVRDMVMARSQGDAPDLGDRWASRLISRMGKVAYSPDERVSHLITLGDARARDRDAAGAIDAYQTVLLDDDLAGASWTDGRVDRRAELIAGSRVRETVTDAGRSTYRRFEQTASDTLDALGEDASAESFEAVARRYPMASVSPIAWQEAAARYDAEGRTHASLSALGAGLDACGWAISSRSDRRRVGAEIAGRLITQLRDADRAVAAASVLESLSGRGITSLTLDGAPLSINDLQTQLAEGLAGSRRFPLIGSSVLNPVSAMPGWMLVEPLSRSMQGAPTEHVLLLSRRENVVAMFGADTPGGDMRRLWSRPRQGRGPRLVRANADTTLLAWDSELGVKLESVETISGKTRWVSEPFDSAMGTVLNPDIASRKLDTPIDGSVRLSGSLIVEDERTVLLLQRAGRACAIDRETGRVLWTLDRGLPVVFDATVRGGVLAVCGDTIAGAKRSPMATTIDARTGATLHLFDDLQSPVRWCRLSPNGALVLGMDAGVMRLDPSRGETLWHASDPAALLTGDAWAFDDRVIVLGPDRQLSQISMRDGSIRPEALDDRGRIGSGQLLAWRTAEGVGFATELGVVMFDASGQTVGADPLGGRRPTLLIAPGQTHTAMLETRGQRGEDNTVLATLSIVRSDSGYLESAQELELRADPSHLRLLDGRVLVTAGSVTIAYDAPAQ